MKRRGTTLAPIKKRRAFDFSRCNLRPSVTEIKAAICKWADECQKLGLHTLQGCQCAASSK